MIARLKGTVAEIGEDHLVVDVHGVGYLVQASPRLLRALPGEGGAIDLIVETQVREDAITLIGFASAAEKRLFKLLQGIQGVGSRLALAILGVLEPDAFAKAVLAGDKAAITRAPGVGPKLAQRILAELKDRIGQLPASPQALPTGPAPAGSAVDDVLVALAQLGYARSEAYDAARQASVELGEGAAVQTLLKRALQQLGQQSGARGG
ncbi:MAG: Holliday junction branch migration protein RuvA [Geminicoccaceae bacterium]|nr:MAG: Holliday junction branch migration protein RuvA [Geminicoccaceae bacterium]